MEKTALFIVMCMFGFFVSVSQSFGLPRYAEDIESFPFGWKFKVSVDEHMLYGCIQRSTLHWGFAIVRNERTPKYEEKINVHIARWDEGDKVCAAVYESSTQWCRKMCVSKNDPYGDDDLKQFSESMTKNLLIDLGVASSIAVAFRDFVFERATGFIVMIDPDGTMRYLMFPDVGSDS